jgi:hypothetical protein
MFLVRHNFRTPSCCAFYSVIQHALLQHAMLKYFTQESNSTLLDLKPLVGDSTLSAKQGIGLNGHPIL